MVTHENKNTDFKLDGKWVLRSQSSGKFIQTRLGALHNNVTQRAKPGGSYQTSHPSYIGVSLHPDWEDAQNFCDWVVQQKGWGKEDWSLDKDLLVPGNRVYGPHTCCFLPREVNDALKPVTGMSIAQQPNSVQPTWGCYYKANGRTTTKRGFTSEAEVKTYYRGLREGVVLSLARKYSQELDARAYQALAKWELVFN